MKIAQFGKSGDSVVKVVVFVAALVAIAKYIEESNTPLKVAQMISFAVTPELLNLVYRLLLLFLVAIGLFRLRTLEKRVQIVKGWQDSLTAAVSQTDDKKSIVTRLLQKREWASQFIFSWTPVGEYGVGQLEAEWRSWRREVIQLLEEVCNEVEVSRFKTEQPGSTENVRYVYDDRHRKLLSFVGRDLQVLMEIIDRLNSEFVKEERSV